MLSLMGIMIVFALSYNMLLGETGLLSFGHAVYYGLGGFLAVHAMNTVIHGRLPVPLFLIPLVGAFSGLLFGIIFGSVSTRRAGTAFAMISLGLGELVASSSLILRGFFGGEEGVSTDRTKLMHVFGLNFGPQIQVYYLIAGWCLICMMAMYALRRTPFGRICNAVRENAERVQFIGYSPQARWPACSPALPERLQRSISSWSIRQPSVPNNPGWCCSPRISAALGISSGL
jgi:branched-chain amino acid transport system permease protein